MTRTFDPIREMDRLLSDVTRTPATVAVPMDLYREGDDYTVRIVGSPDLYIPNLEVGILLNFLGFPFPFPLTLLLALAY